VSGYHVDAPADPQDRPQRTRRASRVLVLDPDGRALLFRDSDHGLNPVPHWWITPGGGVDPGESDLAAAVRELREETGLQLSPDAFVGPVATRRVLHGYSDHVTRQDEVFYAVHVAQFTPDATEHTEEELVCLVGHGWFGPEELAALDEPFWPANLTALVAHARALAGNPDLDPLDLPDVEESTVPA
jgi:8-oxo-dGTP pyrophosphatase MutT (NUDIX family)